MGEHHETHSGGWKGVSHTRTHKRCSNFHPTPIRMFCQYPAVIPKHPWRFFCYNSRVEDPTFVYRVLAGLTFFCVFGFLDYRKNPRNPARLKEYLFIFTVTAFAMVYGVLHDFVTWSLSHEYFIIGKGLGGEGERFGWGVIKIAMRATWSVGLLVGASFLIANNPTKDKPQLSYQKLFQTLSLPLGASFVCAIIFGTSGHLFPDIFLRLGSFDFLDTEVSDISAFVTVWWIHIGSYVGAFLGMIAGILIVHRRRGAENNRY